jgi:hypothetical protein
MYLDSTKEILNDNSQDDAETLKFNIVQISTYYGRTPIRARFSEHVTWALLEGFVCAVYEFVMAHAQLLLIRFTSPRLVWLHRIPNLSSANMSRYQSPFHCRPGLSLNGQLAQNAKRNAQIIFRPLILQIVQHGKE